MPRRIKIRGRFESVLSQLLLGGKKYYLLEKLSGRPRFRAFDADAGPDGNYRAIHALARSDHALQYIKVLERGSYNNGNFPAIISYHVMGNQIYLVLPWIQGRTLRNYIDASRPKGARGLSVFEANRLLRGFAHGLRQLSNKKNIVHGDLKPENLIVCREPNRLVAIDFGSAWMVERTATRGEGDGLSEPYSAPESLRGERFVDFRSDLFSASVIYYEMLTFALPYDGAGGLAGTARYSQNRSTLIPPSQLCRQRDLLGRPVWNKIDEVVVRGIALDAEARYRNQKEWLSALDDIRFEIDKAARVDTEPSQSSAPPGFWRRLFSRGNDTDTKSADHGG